MTDFSGSMGSQRAAAYSGSELNSDTLLREARYHRKHAVDDLAERLARLERVVRALGALLRDQGVSEERVEQKARELVRATILGDSASGEPVQ